MNISALISEEVVVYRLFVDWSGPEGEEEVSLTLSKGSTRWEKTLLSQPGFSQEALLTPKFLELGLQEIVDMANHLIVTYPDPQAPTKSQIVIAIKKHGSAN